MKTLNGLLLALVAFASAQGIERFYEPIPVSLPETLVGQDYTLPLDLSLVGNLDLFGLGDEEKALLELGMFPSPGSLFQTITRRTRL